MNGRIVWITAAATLLAGCGLTSPKTGKGDKKAQGQIPPHLRAGAAQGNPMTGTPVTPGGNTSAFTPNENLVFTDPDNPDALIPELDTVLEGTKMANWEQSETRVRRLAMQEGKPILMWFTDTREKGGAASSPQSKLLYGELFGTPQFSSWAKDHVVRFQVDLGVQGKNKNDEYSKQDYVETLRKRYRVLGNPVVIVLSPDGEVIGRYVGYKRGNSDFFWGQLKSAVILATKRYDDWKKDMEKKGYRQWEDRLGRKVFAKLGAYRNGELILIETDGRRSRTQESKLSEADRLWIAQQKQARGLQ